MRRVKATHPVDVLGGFYFYSFPPMTREEAEDFEGYLKALRDYCDEEVEVKS